MTARAEQLEAWPELRRNERLTRAINLATDRATYLVRQSWPNVSAANRAQLMSIVVSAIAVFDHDQRQPE